jgi:hypothetical protein
MLKNANTAIANPNLFQVITGCLERNNDPERKQRAACASFRGGKSRTANADYELHP